jgi:hypothetical protein
MEGGHPLAIDGRANEDEGFADEYPGDHGAELLRHLRDMIGDGILKRHQEQGLPLASAVLANGVRGR